MDSIDRSSSSTRTPPPGPSHTLVPGALAPGATYALERELGRGGMATVYLARDRKHDRAVAVKVLHAELAAAVGPERFLHEIRVTAHLQHPHVLGLIDSGVFVDDDGDLRGRPYYVMPYVPGESLRRRLEREGALPVADALHIATEVAAALDYAHRHGVVHRDVKPENILLDEDGEALVSDFGIALAVAQAGGARLTQTGLSLGTPTYMAPEQAMGERQITARADVYALGAVTYEMLAGEPPFTGPSAQAVVARVMTEAPRALCTQRPSVPAHVDAAVRTALEKLPADRFASAAAFAAALSTPTPLPAAAVPAPVASAISSAPGPRRSVRALRSVLAGGALLVAAAIGWAVRAVQSPARADDRVPVRFVIAPDSVVLDPTPTVSPDDRTVVYAAEGPQGRRLYARRIDELAARPLAGTEDAEWPFFSPDGAWVGFNAGGAIRKVPLAGGPPTVVVELSGPTPPGPAAWGTDDMIYYASTAARAPGVYRVPAAGGVPTLVSPGDTVGALYNSGFRARPLAGGRVLLVSRGLGGSGVLATMEARDLRSGRVRTLGRGVAPHYAAGYVVYSTADGRLFRRPFDVARLAPTGPEEEIARDVMGFDVSPSGTLVYREGVPTTPATGRMILVDRTGQVLHAFPDRAPWAPRFSPDGRRIAYGAFGREQASSDVWVTDLAAQTTQRLTADSADNNDPQWSPDGRSLVYSAVRPGTAKDLFVQPLAGGAVRPLPSRPGAELPSDWSPDGQTVAYTTPSASSMDIWLQPANGGEARPYLATAANEAGLRISPDGRWAAYMSDETGRWEVYVQAYPTPREKTLVSVAGGINPVWGRDGRTLYYWRGGPPSPRGYELVAARVGTEGGDGSLGPLVVRGRTTLFPAPYLGMGPLGVIPLPLYDVSADGSRVVVVTAPPPPNRLVVALHALAARGGVR